MVVAPLAGHYAREWLDRSMDPNACLEELRALVAQQLKDEPLDEDQTNRLAELFDGLDEWLAKSGFLPDAWEHAQ